MSFKVLVIPEDPTYNGYILKPLVAKIMESIGRPNAFINVLTNPKLNGYEHAKASLKDICKRYSHFDLVLFIPDNDCSQGRQDALNKLSERLCGDGYKVVCVAALEEVETWLLSAHKNKIKTDWQTVKQDCSVKENYFYPFLEQFGDNSPGGGREELMKEGLKRYRAMITLNPELKFLREEIIRVIA
jgi:hypothetical protein